MRMLSVTTAQPKDTPTTDGRESLVLGIYDRLYDHGHCAVDVVLAPAKDDGAPDWERADPATVEALPHDLFPDDAADRACVIVSNVDGCDPDATFLVRFVDDKPDLIQIHGPEIDRPIAEQIIARDIGAVPPVSVASKLQESLAKLAEKFERETEQRHQAANDNNPPAGKAPWQAIDPADYAGKPVPARQWYIDGMIPARNVTLLSGDGGTGKSLLALQIATAGALGIGTLDLKPRPGRTLVLAAEDEWDEVHRRLFDICAANHADLSDLRGMMRVLPLAGHDAELARPDRNKVMQPTERMQWLVDNLVAFRPALVVLDSSADLFGGDEINRNQVRWFVSTLRGLAMELDTAMMLLSHPSVQGMQTGTGLSGSTAWNNSVRSRLYLTADKEDDDLRVLRGMKANYGRKGDELRMRWQDGVFMLDDGKPTAAAGLVNKKAERVFLALLSQFNRNGQTVSDASGANYAPKRFSEHPDAAGVNKKALAEAMQRLLDRGDIKIIMVGKPSAQRKKLIVAAEDFGPAERTA